MRSFVIRRTFLLPLGLLLALCLALLVVCLVQGQPRGKVIILGTIILPVLVLFVESIFRRVTVDDGRLVAFRFLRHKALPLAEITEIETVQVRRRVFLTLSAGDEFLILSNAYGNFPLLVQDLLQRVPAAAVTEETRTMAAAPPSKSSDIVSCWLAVALLSFILFIQLRGHL